MPNPSSASYTTSSSRLYLVCIGQNDQHYYPAQCSVLSAHPPSHLLSALSSSNIPQQFLPAHLLHHLLLLPNTPSLTFITWWTSYTLSFLRLIHHNVHVIVGMGHSLLKHPSWVSESAIHINLEFWDIHKLRICSADVVAAARQVYTKSCNYKIANNLDHVQTSRCVHIHHVQTRHCVHIHHVQTSTFLENSYYL